MSDFWSCGAWWYLLILHIRVFVKIFVADLSKHFRENLTRVLPGKVRIIASFGLASLCFQRKNWSYPSKSKIDISFTKIISNTKSTIIDCINSFASEFEFHTVHATTFRYWIYQDIRLKKMHFVAALLPVQIVELSAQGTYRISQKGDQKFLGGFFRLWFCSCTTFGRKVGIGRSRRLIWSPAPYSALVLLYQSLEPTKRQKLHWTAARWFSYQNRRFHQTSIFRNQWLRAVANTIEHLAVSGILRD